jgi:hypothetical protein
MSTQPSGPRPPAAPRAKIARRIRIRTSCPSRSPRVSIRSAILPASIPASAPCCRILPQSREEQMPRSVVLAAIMIPIIASGAATVGTRQAATGRTTQPKNADPPATDAQHGIPCRRRGSRQGCGTGMSRGRRSLDDPVLLRARPLPEMLTARRRNRRNGRRLTGRCATSSRSSCSRRRRAARARWSYSTLGTARPGSCALNMAASYGSGAGMHPGEAPFIPPSDSRRP